MFPCRKDCHVSLCWTCEVLENELKIYSKANSLPYFIRNNSIEMDLFSVIVILCKNLVNAFKLLLCRITFSTCNLLQEQTFMLDQSESDVEIWNLSDEFCKLAQIRANLRQEYLHNEDFFSSDTSDILDLWEMSIGLTKGREWRHSEGLRRKFTCSKRRANLGWDHDEKANACHCRNGCFFGLFLTTDNVTALTLIPCSSLFALIVDSIC